MRRKLSLLITLTAWLFATGSQWDLVQVVAWARMLADNAKTLPLGAALQRTFSPEGRCELCHAVSAAKQEQDRGTTPTAKFEGKIFLVFEPTPSVFVEAPVCAAWSPADCLMRSAGRSAPLLPPPRSLV